MRILSIALFLCIAASCNPSQPGSQNLQAESPVASGVTFRFSAKPAANDLNDLTTWCNNTYYTEAPLISADTANSHRRLFLIKEGVYRVRLQLGNAASSFFLQKTGEKEIEISTSDNFPLCSSNRANFELAGENTWFKYDNERGIHYTVETHISGGALFVVLTLPPTPAYGFVVHRCPDCR